MAWKRTYFDPGDALCFSEIPAVAIAQRQNGATGAKHLFPKMREGMRRGVNVDLDALRGFVMFANELTVPRKGQVRLIARYE